MCVRERQELSVVFSAEPNLLKLGTHFSAKGFVVWWPLIQINLLGSEVLGWMLMACRPAS